MSVQGADRRLDDAGRAAEERHLVNRQRRATDGAGGDAVGQHQGAAGVRVEIEVREVRRVGGLQAIDGHHLALGHHHPLAMRIGNGAAAPLKMNALAKSLRAANTASEVPRAHNSSSWLHGVWLGV